MFAFTYGSMSPVRMANFVRSRRPRKLGNLLLTGREDRDGLKDIRRGGGYGLSGKINAFAVRVTVARICQSVLLMVGAHLSARILTELHQVLVSGAESRGLAFAIPIDHLTGIECARWSMAC